MENARKIEDKTPTPNVLCLEIKVKWGYNNVVIMLSR